MRAPPRVGRFALVLLLSVVGIVPADTLHVIELRHRPAAEIEPVVRPLLRADEGLSATGYQLILRASESRRVEIERIVRTLDVAPRQLTVTVRQTVARDEQRRRDAVSGEIGIGSRGNVIVGDKPPSSTDGQDSVRYRGQRQTSTASEAQLQTLRVQDGKSAFIRIGQSQPAIERIVVLTGRGPVLAERGVQLRDFTTGFDVLPRVRGDTVELEITPRLAGPKAAEGVFRFQELRTTVSVHLGEWIDLGALVTQSSDVHRAILESAATQTGERADIALKVE